VARTYTGKKVGSKKENASPLLNFSVICV